MQDYNIEVGDRITLKYRNENREYQWLMTCKSDIETALEDNKEILKMERIGQNGWYTVYEKEKELLTEEEREFLKNIIKYYDITYITFESDESIDLANNKTTFCYIDYPKNLRFKNVKRYKEYTLQELGLEE